MASCLSQQFSSSKIMTKQKLKSNFSILFVDDEEKSGKYFKKIFQNDFDIITTTNANDAWKIICEKSATIAIVVSDQRMPLESGVELLNKVKTKYPDIIRVLTTAYANLTDNIAAINESNVFGYLSKPWEIDNVRTILGRAFDKFQTNISLRGLSGSIAHEVRNPLNTINLSLNQIKDYIESTQEKCKMNCVESQIGEMINIAFSSIKRANELIDITLNNVGGKEIDSGSFVYLDARDLILKAIKEFGYQNERERDKVILDKIGQNHSFIFKGDETLMVYILFNLIKNSLYYQAYRDDFSINISLSSSKTQHILKVRDNGPGIAPDQTEFIFEDFVTSGKEGGTGLGLPFCRRAMNSFGGSIVCDSVVGEFTEFTLSFPIIGQDDIEDAKLENSLLKNEDLGKIVNIIIFVDEKFGKKTSAQIKKYFKNANINFAHNDEKILDYLNRKDQFFIILVQDSLLGEIGERAANALKESSGKLAVILLEESNGGDFKSVLAIDSVLKINDQNYDENLIRTLCKWNFIKYVPSLPKVLDKDYLFKKKILLADDEEVNLMLLSRILTGRGVLVDQARDGNELYEKYVDGGYDLIISDINMPKLSGSDAVAKIRKYERENGLKIVPAMSYGGDSEKEKIHQILKSGIDDYFIKGDDVKYLLNLIRFWI